MPGEALVKIVTALGVDHRADDGELVHHAGHSWEFFANLNSGHVGRDGLEFPANVRRGVWLQVEHILMGRTTGEQDVDDRFVGPAGSGTVFGLQQAGQGGSGYTKRANGEK
jgi:hypothetical protein